MIDASNLHWFALGVTLGTILSTASLLAIIAKIYELGDDE